MKSNTACPPLSALCEATSLSPSTISATTLPAALVFTVTVKRGGSYESVFIFMPRISMCALGMVYSHTGRYMPAPEYQRLLG